VNCCFFSDRIPLLPTNEFRVKDKDTSDVIFFEDCLRNLVPERELVVCSLFGLVEDVGRVNS
jgi:hypothetical protein